ncbi:peroxiredoxin family protein [Steroidobacter sp.]|uniref:peroxiredoxin family protein n=1 Tax=Steroidobacter sp. TaxID=1978227 RepID=UPI001A3E2C85|nr:TlpA disulfide reductase family protein [Steroidobacter sp.]MBL8271213.1 TlpA family protein disulfide reductase [Steroidobacter sp.]
MLAAGSFAAHAAEKLEGRWDAQLVHGEQVIPFRLDISGAGPTLKGTLYDGFRPNENTSSASFKDGKLELNLEHYLTTISANLDHGKLVGEVFSQSRESSAKYGFVATRHAPAPASAANAPSIAGAWEIPLPAPSTKGEKAFRFVVEQKGAEVAATILRIDGDTGAYSGTFKDGKWVLSHYDGSRPGVIEVTPKSDGTLEVLQAASPRSAAAAAERSNNSYSDAGPDGRYAPEFVAYRPDVARAKGFPEPANFLTHTTARDPNETFAFSFPDVNGKQVSSEDPHFKGKVVVAVVTGTWCPNCHDEAQYLVELDKKYRDKGLAIVALNFEEPEQQATLKRVRAFVKQYGVTYPYLIAGAPAEMWEKVPQLVNLNTWPATVFVGRDGKVRAVHSGFASPASGQYHADLRKEFTQRIETLLAEKAAVQVSAVPASNTAAVAQNSQ